MVNKQSKSPTKPTAPIPSTAEPTSRGILGSKYATNKQKLMALINQIRSTGAAVDVE